MQQTPPAEPGMRLDEVDTPALVIDLDALEANLDHMASIAARAGVKLRPHAKTHKSPVIANLQMAAARWANVFRRSPRRRRWPGAAFPTSWCRTRS